MPTYALSILGALALFAIVLAFVQRRRRGTSTRREPGRQALPEPDPLEAGNPEGEDANEEAVPERDVRFTLFRPGAVVPRRWYTLLVFMHEAEAPQDTLPEELPAEEEVRRQAARILGDESHGYVSAAEDSAQPVPMAGQLMFAVELPGFEINPPAQHISWLEAIQNVQFRIRATPELTGTTARGRLSIYRGPLLLAEMSLIIRVAEVETEPVQENVKTYRKVFASYSHRDEPIVRQVEAVASAIGDSWLRDVHSLRSGEEWNPALARLIEDADVFQLFWSWNSLESEMVRREWMHALALNRSNFIRPVYWEDPFPERPELDLPPHELTALQFCRLPREALPASPVVDAPDASAAKSAGAPSRQKRGFRIGGWLSTAALALLAVSGVLMTQRLGIAPDAAERPEVRTGAESPSAGVTIPEPVAIPDRVVLPPPTVAGGSGGGAGGRGGGVRPTPRPRTSADASTAPASAEGAQLRALRRFGDALTARERSVVTVFPEGERARWSALLDATDVRHVTASAGNVEPIGADRDQASAPYFIVVERAQGDGTARELFRYTAFLRGGRGDWEVERLERVPR